MKRVAPGFAALLLLLAACGRTEHVICTTCPNEASAGRAGAGFGDDAGSGQGGTSNVAGGGQQNFGGLGLQICALGAPDVPLVRYSSIDLEWTLDDILGPGPSLLHDGSERSELGDGRWASPAFVQNLRDGVNARLEADSANLDESQLQPCEADVVDRALCFDTWIAERGLRLYRRPLTDEQLAGYLAQFRELSTLESPLLAARAVLATMTLSPYFVFRIELGGNYATTLAAPAPGGAPPVGLPEPQLPPGTLLSSYEVAARLSHFATRMAPDRELLFAASQNQLTQPQAVVAQLDRLLLSPPTWRARVLQHLEWLWLDDPPSEALGEELGQAMLQQTSAFIDDVLQHRNGSFTELLSSPRQPLNQLLAEHYGSDAALGDAFELVDLDPLRAGVFGQGAWLSRHPRPTLRGERILGRLLCSEVPPPPPNVPMDGLMGATPRERISNATSVNPACQACHSIMDPTGFALEAFDDQGRLTGFDTTGELYLPSSTQRLPVSGPVELGQAIASSPEAKACAALRYLEHVFERRGGGDNDGRWLQCLTRVFDGQELDLNHLARQVAASDAMQRMMRDPSNAVGVGQSSDPLEHALEETSGLLDGFQFPDRAKLEQYMESLRQVQLDEPLQ